MDYTDDNQKKRVAVVGGGISGMSAAYLLAQGGHHVTVYEKGDYLGGHTNTQDAKFGEVTVKCDTGFLVFNKEKYPNLMRLFKELDIKSATSDVSFAFSLNAREHLRSTPLDKIRSEIEWGSDNGSSIFAQWGNFFSFSFWRMLVDLYRFQSEGDRVMANAEQYQNITIRQYVEQRGYSKAFIEYYLVPVMSALWSTSFKEIDQFPILTLVRFFNNHNMFQLIRRPTWHTVDGGSYQYMAKLKTFLESNGSRVKISSPVTKVLRDKASTKVTVFDKSGSETYDHVIFACHPPEIFGLLPDMTYPERKVLSNFKYSHHRVYLHSDENLMPKRKSTWSSWNYLYDDNSLTENKVCVTYWINRIQPWLDAQKTPLYVTLNPVLEPRAELVHKVIDYDHPLYSFDSENSRKKISVIQGIRSTFYCGAYYGFGFHEDGIISGLLAAQAIDPSLNKIWKVDQTRYIDNIPPSTHLRDTTIKVVTSGIILAGLVKIGFMLKDHFINSDVSQVISFFTSNN